MYSHKLDCYCTDSSSKSCVLPLLNRESLEKIVDAPRDDTIFTSLTDSTHVQDFAASQSMPLTESGNLIKFTIAAKFNHDETSGWPVLQIRRGTSSNDFNMTMMMDPKPTGYLNIFEYQLSANIQPGDRIQILREYPATEYESRYLLAYLGHPPKPLVHIDVSNDNQAVTTAASIPHSRDHGTNAATTIVSRTSAETIIESVTSTTTPITKQMKQVVSITVGVLCSLVTLILVAAVISVVFLIHYQCKTNAKHPIRTSVLENTGIDASENMYIPDSIISTQSGGAVASGGCMASASSLNNPNDVSLCASIIPHTNL